MSVSSFYRALAFAFQITAKSVFLVRKTKNNLGSQKAIKWELLVVHLAYLPSGTDDSGCVLELHGSRCAAGASGCVERIRATATRPLRSLPAPGSLQEGADSFCPE